MVVVVVMMMMMMMIVTIKATPFYNAFLQLMIVFSLSRYDVLLRNQKVLAVFTKPHSGPDPIRPSSHTQNLRL
jgi:hypothetical protein